MKAIKAFAIAGGIAALSLTVLSTSPRPASAASGAETLAVRQAVMRSMVTHFRAIVGAIKSGDETRIKAAAPHAMAMSFLAKAIPTVTEKGSGPEAGKTRALPIIWREWAGFKKAAATLATESVTLAGVLKSGNAGAAMAQFGKTGKLGCGGCHRTYRAKKKK